MSDTLRLPHDLASAVRALRLAQGVSMTELSRRTGRSRDTLHRLERGEDVTVSTLMTVLAALGHALSLQKVGMPSLEDMRRRFGSLHEEDDDVDP